MRVLLIAPYYNRNVPGESWSTFKWVEGISRQCQTTVLTTHHDDWNPDESPVEAEEIVNWIDPRLPRRLARLGYELKPGYILFYLRARRWIKKRLKEGWNFDLVHQINPLALRYPSPAAGLGLKYIIGPLAGSLDTPPGFASEDTDRQWFRKLRHLDKLRLRYDPLLRRTYSDAALVLGVAPYVEELLATVGIRRFEVMSETGVESVAETPKQGPLPGEPLRLLFVGRVIRTKGILDAIRAVAIASRTYPLQFDVIGEGDLLATCKTEATRLGIADRVHFHGRLPRETVMQWYEKAHVFLFPSFREPSGNVVFEAMSRGCIVIASSCGGPGYIVDDSCGFRVDPTNPEQFVEDLGTQLGHPCKDRTSIMRLSKNSLEKIKTTFTWSQKLSRLELSYHDLLSGRRTETGYPPSMPIRS